MVVMGVLVLGFLSPAEQQSLRAQPKKESTAERNKRTARRYIEEVLNKGNMKVYDELVSRDYVNHDPQAAALVKEAATARGEAVKGHIAALRRAVPNLKYRIDQMIAEGDYVAVRWTATGRPTSPVLGQEARNVEKQVSVSGMCMTRFNRDGTIAEGHSYWDAGGLMRQLRGAK
jgi:steroid delta-isomerase-like uncharacterized protein